MPEAKFPTTPAGWFVWLGAGLVGLLAGFLWISLCNKVL